MTRLTPSNLSFPTTNLREFRMGSVREGPELVLVTGLADLAAHVICRAVACRFSLS